MQSIDGSFCEVTACGIALIVANNRRGAVIILWSNGCVQPLLIIASRP